MQNAERPCSGAGLTRGPSVRSPGAGTLARLDVSIGQAACGNNEFLPFHGRPSEWTVVKSLDNSGSVL